MYICIWEPEIHILLGTQIFHERSIQLSLDWNVINICNISFYILNIPYCMVNMKILCWATGIVFWEKGMFELWTLWDLKHMNNWLRALCFCCLGQNNHTYSVHQPWEHLGFCVENLKWHVNCKLRFGLGGFCRLQRAYGGGLACPPSPGPLRTATSPLRPLSKRPMPDLPPCMQAPLQAGKRAPQGNRQGNIIALKGPN